MAKIKYEDIIMIIQYAAIFATANNRQDILEKCDLYREEIDFHSKTDYLELVKGNSDLFNQLCPYAIVSSNVADKDIQTRICNIISANADCFDPYELSSMAMLSFMQKNKSLGKKCPYYRLYRYLESRQK